MKKKNKSKTFISKKIAWKSEIDYMGKLSKDERETLKKLNGEINGYDHLKDGSEYSKVEGFTTDLTETTENGIPITRSQALTHDIYASRNDLLSKGLAEDTVKDYEVGDENDHIDSQLESIPINHYTNHGVTPLANLAMSLVSMSRTHTVKELKRSVSSMCDLVRKRNLACRFCTEEEIIRERDICLKVIDNADKLLNIYLEARKDDSGVKACSKCTKVKPLEEFDFQTRNPDKRFSACNSCRRGR